MTTTYEPLLVRAHLCAPVIFDRPQPLDGILAAIEIEDPELRERSRRRRFWRRCVRDRGEDAARAYFRERGFEVPADGGHFTPLATWGHGTAHGLWVYASSWALFEPDSERDIIHFTRRLNSTQLLDWLTPGAAARIEIAKGAYKNIYLAFETVATATLTWFVRGDRSALEEMLNLMHSIGKKRRRGYGVVARWEIEPMATDASVFDPDGALMRPVPAALLDALSIQGQFDYMYTAYRPPYWSPRWATRCAVSGKSTSHV